MTAAQRLSVDPRRRSLLAKVHLARKELGLDEGTYRAALQRITGHASAADCSEAQLGRVLDDFKAHGWTPAAGRVGGRPADHPAATKARALWISLHQLGAVRDPAERALEAFARRQLKVERLQWADQAQAYRLIEALKAIAARYGWDATGGPDADVREMKVQLVKAQWARLTRLGVIAGGEAPVCSGLANWAHRRRLTPGVRSAESWPEATLTDAAKLLAVRIWSAAPTGATG